MAAVPRYQGPFERAQAERLLWRAGFGGTAAQIDKLAAKGLDQAVLSFTRPAKKGLNGPKPKEDGDPLAPYDSYGHDVLHFLDRMVRTQAPLIERMALIWHDWFATGDVGSQRLSLKQIDLFRKHALGSFDRMLSGVTKDPAMLIWLSGIYNTKDSPNENYGRELMELFTLGVSNEDGYPYSEQDVREQARALTGFTADYRDSVGYVNFRFAASPPRQRASRRSSARRGTSTGRTRAGCASSTRPTPRTSSPACGPTSSARRRTLPPSRRWRSCT